MIAFRNNADSRWRRMRPCAFTLVELTVVVAIIGAMAAFAVPSYRRAIEQSRIDIAGANLRAIWAAERLYWLQNQTYTTDIATLRELGLLDRKLPTGNGSEDDYWNDYFYYTIEAGPDGIDETFTAKANASTFTGSTSTLQIDETGELTGKCGRFTPIDFW